MVTAAARGSASANGAQPNGLTSPPAARLQDRVALITGASSGLGRAISFLFAAHGAALVICADLSPLPSKLVNDESTPTHEDICKIHGENKARFVPCNVTKGEDVRAAVKSAVHWGGRLDIIINNAGTGITNRDIRIHQLEEAEWDRIMSVNVRGVFLGCKYACEQFLQQPPTQPNGTRGRIVNIGSIFGMTGFPGGLGAYCASKGAVVNLTRQIAADYAKDRIPCNALCPGFMKTAQSISNFEDPATSAKMMEATPWGEWTSPQDMAKNALYLASDDAAFVTGAALLVDGGFNSV